MSKAKIYEDTLKEVLTCSSITTIKEMVADALDIEVDEYLIDNEVDELDEAWGTDSDYGQANFLLDDE